jgi:hypothetical protein
MFHEPKILPWLARQARVPLPEAREIWLDIANRSAAERGFCGADARRQIRELRLQLKERSRHAQTQGAQAVSDLDWMFPLRLFQTWAECQTRIVLNAWLAWAKRS